MNHIKLSPEIETKYVRKQKLTLAEIAELGSYWLNEELPYQHKKSLDAMPESIFHRHPFGLKLLSKGIAGVRFLGKDGVTEISVAAMRAWLKHNRNFIKALRVIYVEDDYYPEQHLIFFEADGLYETVLCGGCSNCSGVGGTGAERLIAMFFCIARERNIRIQKAVVSEYVYEKIRKKLPN